MEPCGRVRELACVLLKPTLQHLLNVCRLKKELVRCKRQRNQALAECSSKNIELGILKKTTRALEVHMPEFITVFCLFIVWSPVLMPFADAPGVDGARHTQTTPACCWNNSGQFTRLCGNADRGVARNCDDFDATAAGTR